jgi:signal transduction histidine kinase
MAELIDALLDLSRLARVQLEPRELDLSAMVRQIVTAFQEREPDREVDVAIEEGIKAFGDKALIAIALENLLGNAWKFTRQTAAAKIAVHSYAQDSKVGFVVEDNGVGFEMRYAGKLFEPFQRLHSPDEFAGHGIGLATVQRIVQKHGGEVWAEGNPARGARFYVTLPRGRLRAN